MENPIRRRIPRFNRGSYVLKTTHVPDRRIVNLFSAGTGEIPAHRSACLFQRCRVLPAGAQSGGITPQSGRIGASVPAFPDIYYAVHFPRALPNLVTAPFTTTIPA